MVDERPIKAVDGEQGELFPDSSLPDELVGYRGPAACQIAGITYRQLDYWARTDLIRPSLADARGSGSRRRYSAEDIAMLCFIRQMLDSGVRLETIRDAVDWVQVSGGIKHGTIVVVSRDNIHVLEDGDVSQAVEFMRTKPCHTFPITVPDLTRGLCENGHFDHRYPHARRSNCTNWVSG